ncbi:MAG: glutathione-disulfide reductase [Woeseiaceae bacterium]|nr:glutathione-disulfide reductase [Woeseiaceae bacterium]
MSREFDLLVIGGGSGGLAHAQRAAEYGVRAAVIENGPLGGTCVNVGCVPKKVMWYGAQYAHQIEQAADFGFDVRVAGHDWSTLKSRRDAYIRRLNDIYEKNLDRREVTLLRGTARFADAHTLDVDGQQYKAARIVIATGGYPTIPDIPGAELGISSDGFFELERRPDSVIVVGSGYIAVELAGIFSSLGADTRVVVRRDGILRGFEPMLGAQARERLEADGVPVETGFVPMSVRRDETGLHLEAADGRTAGPVDTVLWAIGRSPSTAGLHLDVAGIRTDETGFIPVDDYQATNVEHIFALGDVTGRAALTPVAIAAGRRLADRLYGGMPDRHLDYRDIPTVIFTHPPIGTVGMTEQEARAQFGDAVKVYRSRFNPMQYALSEKKIPTTMQLVTAGADERVVGCHMIGDGVDEILQGFAVAVRMGARKRDLDDTVAIHPTSAEELVTMR